MSEYDNYSVAISVRGQNNDNSGATVAEFSIGEMSEHEAMEVLRAAMRFYLAQWEPTQGTSK